MNAVVLSLAATFTCAQPAEPLGDGGATTTAAASPEVVAAEPAGDEGEPGQCVDATLEEELLAKRKYRLTKDRLFVKNLRHELTILGGYYVSDLFDSTFNFGGSYAFFASENIGSELSFGWSRLRTTTAETIEEANEFDLELGGDNLFRAFATLLWAPLYGKMRVGGKILRYDFHVGAGPGVVVDPLSYGMGGNFLIGTRVFLHPAIALRFEVRDYLYNQGLMRERYVINDIAFNLGFSVFLPPGN